MTFITSPGGNLSVFKVDPTGPNGPSNWAFATGDPCCCLPTATVRYCPTPFAYPPLFEPTTLSIMAIFPENDCACKPDGGVISGLLSNWVLTRTGPGSGDLRSHVASKSITYKCTGTRQVCIDDPPCQNFEDWPLFDEDGNVVGTFRVCFCNEFGEEKYEYERTGTIGAEFRQCDLATVTNTSPGGCHDFILNVQASQGYYTASVVDCLYGVAVRKLRYFVPLSANGTIARSEGGIMSSSGPGKAFPSSDDKGIVGFPPGLSISYSMSLTGNPLP